MLQTFKIVNGIDRVDRDNWFKMAAEHTQQITINIQALTFSAGAGTGFQPGGARFFRYKKFRK